MTSLLQNNVKSRLTLLELEVSAGFRAAVFLPLYHTRVASHISVTVHYLYDSGDNSDLALNEPIGHLAIR